MPDWGHLNAGDHLRVKRRLGYYHHGIYAGDDRVVLFMYYHHNRRFYQEVGTCDC